MSNNKRKKYIRYELTVLIGINTEEKDYNKENNIMINVGFKFEKVNYT